MSKEINFQNIRYDLKTVDPQPNNPYVKRLRGHISALTNMVIEERARGNIAAFNMVHSTGMSGECRVCGWHNSERHQRTYDDWRTQAKAELSIPDWGE